MGSSEASVYLPDHGRSESSQFGENGLIEALFEEIGVRNRVCVDVGAQYLYRRSNVFPLWAHGGWHALLVEADDYLCRQMEEEYDQLPEKQQGSVDIVHARAAARGSGRLDALFEERDLPPEPDLLSIDVDGIDYHLWKHLEEHRPRAVVIEYNSSIPPDRRIVGGEVYNAVGASLGAMLDLGCRRGYGMVAVTPANVLFVVEEEADPFAAVNDMDRMWDPEVHGQFLTRAMRTFEEELFFDRGPVVRDDFDFARPESANLLQGEDVHFVSRPAPHEVYRYFVRYPLYYLFHRSRVFDRLRRWFERRGLSWLIRPLVRILETYD